VREESLQRIGKSEVGRVDNGRLGSERKGMRRGNKEKSRRGKKSDFEITPGTQAIGELGKERGLRVSGSRMHDRPISMRLIEESVRNAGAC